MYEHRILVVDDEATIRLALDRWFTIHGYKVDVAVNGLDAVELCRKHAYSAITLDLEMPLMSGIEAINHIRQLQPRVPILILTGHVSDGQKALALGACRVLSKPIRLRELERHVEEAMREASAKQAS